MKITTIGIDLAKSLFQLHGVDAGGNVVLKKQLKRDQLLSFFVNLPLCLIGMEACGSAHFWARKLQALGHVVKLMAPQFVKARLQGISKRGDTYLRTLLIHGARAVIRHAETKPNGQGWLHRLLARCHKNVAAVALANKNARIVWALLAHNREFQLDCTAAKSSL